MARLSSVSSVDSLEKKFKDLAGRFPDICKLHNLAAHKSHGNAPGFSARRQLYYLRVGKDVGKKRTPVLITAGVHARETSPPAALTNFLEDLLIAYSSKPMGALYIPKFRDKWRMIKVTYPRRPIPADHVRSFIEDLDLFLAPLVNPDGRQFVLDNNLNRMWRKNRAPNTPAAACAPFPQSTITKMIDAGFKPAEIPVHFPNSKIGVDLNRNFDIAWDHLKFYSPAALSETTPGRSVATSNDPCHVHQIYRGAAAASEPEVKFVQWLIDTNQFQYFLDVHMHGRMILPSWSLETNQETNIDSDKSFHKSNWDTKRDGKTGTTYEEYMPKDLRKNLQDLADQMASRIKSVAGSAEAKKHSKYKVKWSKHSTLNLNSGTSKDYAFSRFFDPLVKYPETLSFTLECGHKNDGRFTADHKKHYPKIEREVYAALWAFLSSASGLTSRLKNSSKPGSGGSDDDCFIATAVFGSPSHHHVYFLREVRDQTIKTTSMGRQFMFVVERIYVSFSPQVAGYLRGRQELRALVRIGIVLPVVWQIRTCVLLTAGIRSRELRVAILVGLLSGVALAHIVMGVGLFLFLWNANFSSI